MHTDLAGSLRKEFLIRRDEQTYRRFQQQQIDDRKRRDRDDELKEDHAEFLDLAMTVITATEANEFRVELDQYDTASVAALQVNEMVLKREREKLNKILDKAHVLPDGRRVFKTEDGLRVFDEHGTELDDTAIDPLEILDSRPRWEIFNPQRLEVERLETERSEILDYQRKLDTARERLDAGDLTRQEFDALRDDLKSEIPDAVREQIPELRADKPDVQAEQLYTPGKLEISTDMVPGAFKPM